MRTVWFLSHISAGTLPVPSLSLLEMEITCRFPASDVEPHPQVVQRELAVTGSDLVV